MMYIHYCPACARIHILNGHKSVCPTCDHKLTELRISYLDYIEMDREERRIFHDQLKDSENLLLQKQ